MGVPSQNKTVENLLQVQHKKTEVTKDRKKEAVFFKPSWKRKAAGRQKN